MISCRVRCLAGKYEHINNAKISGSVMSTSTCLLSNLLLDNSGNKAGFGQSSTFSTRKESLISVIWFSFFHFDPKKQLLMRKDKLTLDIQSFIAPVADDAEG